MDSWKYLGDLVPSDEEMLWLKFGWWIWIETQSMDESKLRAILYSCAEQMGRGQYACWTQMVRRGIHEPRTVRVQKCGRSASVRFFRCLLNWLISLWIGSIALVIVLMVKFWLVDLNQNSNYVWIKVGGNSCVPAQNRWVADGPLLTTDGPPWWFSEPRTVRFRKCGWSASVSFFRWLLN